MGTGTSEDVFNFFAIIKGQHVVRICWDSNPDLPLLSPASYLYAAVAGWNQDLIFS